MQELDEKLNDCVGRSDHIFMLLGSTAPNGTDDVVLNRIFFVDCPQVRQLSGSTDQLAMWAFNVDVLQNLRLQNPA